MDDPFDQDGNLSDTGRRVLDTEVFFSTIGRAEGGDAAAQYRMGVWHLDGSNILAKEDKVKAAGWLNKAAEQGHEKAKKVLAQMSHDTSAANEGKPEHLRCYICLADAEYYFCYDDCDRTAERRRIEAKQHQRKGKQILKKAEQGDAEAQLQAGYAYDDGVYLPKDDAKAAEWFHKAAKMGNADAQNRLGFSYMNGRGVKKDDSKAAEWFLKAAEQDSKYAQVRLGRCYEEGRGVTQDYTKAAEWYRKAAAQGDSEAEYYLGKLRKEGKIPPRRFE